MRQVNLGLELICRGGRARATDAAAGLRMLRKVPLHTLRFIHFDRTGVRLLFCYTDLGENVENLFALDL
jgi:hypothetical protein